MINLLLTQIYENATSMQLVNNRSMKAQIH